MVLESGGGEGGQDSETMSQTQNPADEAAQGDSCEHDSDLSCLVLPAFATHCHPHLPLQVLTAQPPPRPPEPRPCLSLSPHPRIFFLKHFFT